jgi:hypothetical protein
VFTAFGTVKTQAEQERIIAADVTTPKFLLAAFLTFLKFANA